VPKGKQKKKRMSDRKKKGILKLQAWRAEYILGGRPGEKKGDQLERKMRHLQKSKLTQRQGSGRGVLGEEVGFRKRKKGRLSQGGKLQFWGGGEDCRLGKGVWGGLKEKKKTWERRQVTEESPEPTGMARRTKAPQNRGS